MDYILNTKFLIGLVVGMLLYHLWTTKMRKSNGA